MKAFKTYYLAFGSDDVMITDDVSYYTGDVYLCKDMDDKDKIMAVKGNRLVKLTESNLKSIITDIIKANRINMRLELETVKTSLMFNSIIIELSKGGFCAFDNIFFHIDIPKNIMKAEYIRIDRISKRNFGITSCDSLGHVQVNKGGYAIGYSNRCNILYSVIKDNPDVDTHTLYSLLGWDGCQLAPRLSELTQAGRIVCTGKIYTGNSNRRYSQWRVVDGQ